MGPMTATLPRPEGASEPVPTRAGLPPRRAVDCEVCVVGDGLAARMLSYRLAALGRQVVRIGIPGHDDLPIDPVLTPGFARPARELVDRIGHDDAAELWYLTQDAAGRLRDTAISLDLPLGAKGMLRAARPHAAHSLLLEHDIIAEIAPGAARFIGARDLEGLLGTRTFSAAIGLVPAVRLPGPGLSDAFAALAVEAGARDMAASGPLSFDLKGLRKYVDVGAVRVRAFDVILCGAEAVRQGAPQLAEALVTTYFAAGRMPVTQVSAREALPPFAGRVEAFGGTALSYHVDDEGLALAVETMWPVRMSWSAARVLRHQVRRLYPEGQVGPPERARGYGIVGTRSRMPLVGALDKGVWVAGGLGLQPLPVHLLSADLLAEAIALKDDRVSLLQPFLAPEPKRPFAFLKDMTDYWRARLTARLAKAESSVPDYSTEPRTSEGEGLPAGRGSPLPRARDGARMPLRPAPGGSRGADGPSRSAQRGPKDGV